MKAEELAKWFHDKYEVAAKLNNWGTQDSCKVSFENLPEANRKTMIDVCKLLLDKLDYPSDQEITEYITQRATHLWVRDAYIARKWFMKGAKFGKFYWQDKIKKDNEA